MRPASRASWARRAWWTECPRPGSMPIARTCSRRSIRPSMARRLGGLRHLPQPGQPVLVGLLPTLRQRIEPASLLGGETIGQPAIALPDGPGGGARRRAARARRGDGTTIRRCRHVSITSSARWASRSSSMACGRSDACQLGCGTFAERTKPELLLAFDGMTLAVPLRREILVDRRQDAEY